MNAIALADSLIESLLQNNEPLPEKIIKEMIADFVQENNLSKEQRLEVLEEFKKAEKDELSVGEVKIVEKALNS